MHHGAVNNNSILPKSIVSKVLHSGTTLMANPPTQNQQISKSIVYLCYAIKYSTWVGYRGKFSIGFASCYVCLSIPTPRAVFYRTALVMML